MKKTSSTTVITPIETACLYASWGWRVYPAPAGSKGSYITSWPTAATTDPKQIEEWWKKWPDANVKIVAVGGGLSYGALGYTHHGVEDLAIMRSLPKITVM